MKVPFINLEFFFEGKAVGLFEGFKYPAIDGEYQYEPYRGIGHFEMWKTIKERGIAVCFYIKGNVKVVFNVKDSGKYGKLILTEFRKEFFQS